MEDLTLILQKTEGDERVLAEKVLPLVYEELRRLAASRMSLDAFENTLQPTALLHEAWLKMVRDCGRTWENRAHFYRAAAIAMRHIMIDRARQKSAAKRAGGLQRVDITNLNLAATSPDDHLLLIDESLQCLEREAPECAEVVMLKYFSGLTNKDTALTLGVSEATVQRRWAFAKIRLFQIIRETQGEES